MEILIKNDSGQWDLIKVDAGKPFSFVHDKDRSKPGADVYHVFDPQGVRHGHVLHQSKPGSQPTFTPGKGSKATRAEVHEAFNQHISGNK